MGRFGHMVIRCPIIRCCLYLGSVVWQELLSIGEHLRPAPCQAWSCFRPLESVQISWGRLPKVPQGPYLPQQAQLQPIGSAKWQGIPLPVWIFNRAHLCSGPPSKPAVFHVTINESEQYPHCGWYVLAPKSRGTQVLCLLLHEGCKTW